MPGSQPLEIVADDRERASGVLDYLRADEKTRIVVRRLALGDYLVGERVLVERKTVRDFCVSIIDGRLFGQACRMAESEYRPVLIVEGKGEDERATGVSREAIQGSVITLSLFLGIPCLRSAGIEETANLIRYTGRQLHRDINGGVYRHGYRPKGQRKRRLFVLQGLPGVGPARAARLLDACGSLENVFSADVETLARVAGLGCKTAETIRALAGPDGDQDHRQSP